jgi:myo-inositol-1(or 4)-monophosphatase
MTAQNKVLHLIALKYENEVVLSEEIHKDDPYQNIPTEGYTWVIDPLDGTNNFVNRIPFFCSAIGILKDRKPFIGAIFDPVLNEVYFAIQGHQSKVWKISTGETTPISTDPHRTLLDQALIATHISSRAEVAQRLFANDFFLEMSRRFKHIRAFGCGQLALAYVASGRLQAFLQMDSYIWDQVAGVVILNNAGGVAQEFNLDTRQISEWNYKTKNILACSNNLILEAFQAEFLS